MYVHQAFAQGLYSNTGRILADTVGVGIGNSHLDLVAVDNHLDLAVEDIEAVLRCNIALGMDCTSQSYSSFGKRHSMFYSMMRSDELAYYHRSRMIRSLTSLA